MTKLTYVAFDGTRFDVEAANGSTGHGKCGRNNIPGIEAECGGACACATCHVYVDEAWTALVGEPRRWKRTCSTLPSTCAPIPGCRARSKVAMRWTASSSDCPKGRLFRVAPPRRDCTVTQRSRVTDEGRIDAVVIGAGPIGLFAVFQLGLFASLAASSTVSTGRAGNARNSTPTSRSTTFRDGRRSRAGARRPASDADRAIQAEFRLQPALPRISSGWSDGRFRAVLDDGERSRRRLWSSRAGWGRLRPRAAGPRGQGRMVKPNPVLGWGLDLKAGRSSWTARSSRRLRLACSASATPTVSRQAEADPVGLSRGGADAQAARRIVRPSERAPLPVTTSSSELQKKLGLRDGQP